jgi:hypothetical protein
LHGFGHSMGIIYEGPFLSGSNGFDCRAVLRAAPRDFGDSSAVKQRPLDMQPKIFKLGDFDGVRCVVF